MKFTTSIPALPVKDIDSSVHFYEDRLGFSCQYMDEGFARVIRDNVELHLWAACDKSWIFRSILLFLKPIWSGAESFLAGTSSCRIGVERIDDLFIEYKESGVLYNSSTIVEETAWKTREFPALDLYHNLLTFYEPLS